MTTQLPPWLDRTEYPFALHTFQVPAGRLNYVDEGQGPPLVFVHGNPSWSFEFRHVIKQLSATRRCIAVDHLGFGLSDKPADFSYLPVDQAKNFSLFMESLDLHDVTLVVGDWGGPIGLSYALEHPERIRSLVITNTWLWSVKSDWYYQGFSGFMGGPIGRHLIRTRNFFADQVVKACFPDKRALTPLTDTSSSRWPTPQIARATRSSRNRSSARAPGWRACGSAARCWRTSGCCSRGASRTSLFERRSSRPGWPRFPAPRY
jgi:haloalkane dehalogenase